MSSGRGAASDIIRRMEGRRDAGRLTVVLPSLDIGGVQRLYVDVLGELCARGVACRIVAPDGALRPQVQDRGIAWSAIDWSARLSSYRALAAQVPAGEPAVLIADPTVLHVLPALIARGPTALALHSTPAGFEDWLEPRTLARLRALLPVALARRGLALLTIGEEYVRGYATFFGVDESGISLLPPAVDSGRIAFAAPRERLDAVLCLARLSPEKSPQIRAGIDLVCARLRIGQPCRLDVIGDGPWRGRAEMMCAASLPAGAYAFHGATLDPRPALRAAPVVAATGMAALEAACAGARVVIVRTTLDDAGALGPVLSPDSYDERARESFGARVPAPRSAEATWADLEALTPAQLEQVRARIERCHGPEAAADAVMEALAATSSGGALQMLAVLGEQLAGLQDELRETSVLADELWAQRADFEIRRP